MKIPMRFLMALAFILAFYVGLSYGKYHYASREAYRCAEANGFARRATQACYTERGLDAPKGQVNL